jgi:hypothetical protein
MTDQVWFQLLDIFWRLLNQRNESLSGVLHPAHAQMFLVFGTRSAFFPFCVFVLQILAEASYHIHGHQHSEQQDAFFFLSIY